MELADASANQLVCQIIGVLNFLSCAPTSSLLAQHYSDRSTDQLSLTWQWEIQIPSVLLTHRCPESLDLPLQGEGQHNAQISV